MCIRDREDNVGTSNEDRMNFLQMMFNKMQKCFDERKKLMDNGFNEFNKCLDEQNTILDDMINNTNKRDEKWEGDRYRLKENTEG